ncbi:MAG: hypothetical protein JXN61_03640 [Sedimentisphaerales bacterium]|nr:hypothetical protein [Sedimentisphaerales bacterium]
MNETKAAFSDLTAGQRSSKPNMVDIFLAQQPGLRRIAAGMGLGASDVEDVLQEMQIIQTIELKGAEARRKAAVAIRQREKDFFDLYDQWLSLDSEVEGLKSRIRNREEEIAKIEETLANPKTDMLPPKIYQDKVVIYRVAEQDNAPGEE